MTPSLCNVGINCNSMLYAYTLILVGPQYKLKNNFCFIWWNDMIWHYLFIYVWKHHLLCTPALWETLYNVAYCPQASKTMKLFI